MTPEDARDRKALCREVEYGQISPAEADAELVELGQKPFQSRRLDLSTIDPMTEAEWTLPMTAAWFIWRTSDAVRDQWNPARVGWRKWVRVPRRVGGLGGRRGPSWKLKSFGRATLQDALSQAGLAREVNQGKVTAQRSIASDLIHTPYSRLKRTLQSGDIQATWGKLDSDDFEKLPPEYWQREFEAIANPKKQSRPERPAPDHLGSTVKTLTFQNSTPRLRNPVHSRSPTMPVINLHELEDLPDLSLTETSTSQTQEEHRHSALPYEENNEVFLRREDVILAEQKISQIEYEQPDWSLGQALGWVAYRRREAFRSLWETDLNPPPNYYGEAYSSGLVTDDPASALREALLSEKLIGRVGGESLSPAKWLDLDVWGVRRIKFLRTDVIKVWVELNPSPPPKKPSPSDEQLTNVHEELDRALGKPSQYQQFYDKLKELGIAPRC